MKYLSLFSGIGGLEYGLGKLGFDAVAFSEIKEASIAIYKKHFEEVDNLGDITKVSIKALPDFDLVVGGFPCQTFSLAGLRRGFNDPRGLMIMYINNILVAKKPKYFVLENVKGILSHDDGRTFLNIQKLLQSSGYNVRTLLLNSIHYGSAQSRERIILLGSLDKYEYPKPIIKNGDGVFRDVRDNDKGRFYEFNELRKFNLELIGDYDRVGTLTTGVGCGNKKVAVEDKFRDLTVLECERLQGFPEGWTYVDGIKDKDRYWALGNAVNCNVSEYLFCDYLRKVWWANV